MKNVCWIAAGAAAVALVGFLVWRTMRRPPVEELAESLEIAWADNHTIL